MVNYQNEYKYNYDIPPDGSKSDPYWWDGSRWNINPGSVLKNWNNNQSVFSDSPGLLSIDPKYNYNYNMRFITYVALKSNPKTILRTIKWGINISKKGQTYYL